MIFSRQDTNLSRGSPYNGLYREAPPVRGTFFRLQVYERVRISLVEVHQRQGKSVISCCKKAQKGYQMHFLAVRKARKKILVLSFIHILKTMHLRQ